MQRNKSKNDAELKPNKSFVTAHLVRFYLIDKRHNHTYKTPKEMEVATSLIAAVESSSHDLNSEPLRRGPRARTSRRHVWPFDATNGVSGAISARIRGRGNC